MNKIKTILFAILILLSPTLVIASEGTVIGDKEIKEMSQKYIEVTNEQLKLDLNNNQKKEMTEIMVNYVYQFKNSKNTDETREIELKFTDDIKEILNEEQWKIISIEIEKKENLNKGIK